MKPIKVGIVANEFFDPKINRVGGFGWAGQRAMQTFKGDPRFAQPVFFSGEFIGKTAFIETAGNKIVLPSPKRFISAWRAWNERPDILLCIDYRPSYLRWLRGLPFTPVIVWVRDPRTPTDMVRLNSLRVPGTDKPPAGIHDCDFRSLARFLSDKRFPQRRVVLANKMAYMRDKNEDTFGLPPSDWTLPNPDVVDYDHVIVRKSERPSVVSLGRLDPVKRPWLFIELARAFPEADFLMLGQPFAQGPGGWSPQDVPPNVKLLGNVSGQPKYDILSRAWVLVNTSIHEESAVSMLEALAHEVPVISFIESDGISARFGKCLGYDTGTGLQSLGRLKETLRELLTDHAQRTTLGRLGREWVRSEHNTGAFLNSFLEICRHFGVRLPDEPVHR